MRSNYTNKYNSDHLNDWIIYCDICGKPTWYSQSVLLKAETGRGGLLVCMQDADPIDYGLVPYNIPAESMPTTTRINSIAYTSTPDTLYDAFDYSALDPMSYNPSELLQVHRTWDHLSEVTWENMNIFTWEQLQ